MSRTFRVRPYKSAKTRGALFQTGCEGKQRFHTDRGAQFAADSYSEMFGRKMRIYRCEFCKKFHLSSNEVY